MLKCGGEGRTYLAKPIEKMDRSMKRSLCAFSTCSGKHACAPCSMVCVRFANFPLYSIRLSCYAKEWSVMKRCWFSISLLLFVWIVIGGVHDPFFLSPFLTFYAWMCEFAALHFNKLLSVWCTRACVAVAGDQLNWSFLLQPWESIAANKYTREMIFAPKDVQKEWE